MTKTVIIGAGFGGLGCAHNLAKDGRAFESVTLVDAKDWFTIGGGAVKKVASHLSENALRHSLFPNASLVRDGVSVCLLCLRVR